MKIKVFAECMATLEAGTGKGLSEQQLEVWYACLGDVEPEFLKAAILQYLCEGDDWPSIAKIRRMAMEQRHGITPEAYEALEHVKAAVSVWCQYSEERQVDACKMITDDEHTALRRVGGWVRFKDVLTKDVGILYAQFRDAFREIVGNRRRLQNLPDQIRPKIEGKHGKALENLANNMRLPEA